MNNLNKFKILLIAIVIGFLGTHFFTWHNDINSLQEDIAEKILRFHVIANSDNDCDQTLKLKVKDEVVNYMSNYLTDTMSLDEAVEVVLSHRDEIISLSEGIIAENGYSYSVNAEITTCYFPVKAYGDITLPAGDYRAFRITIGDAKGKNWWCILYPPLCFVDVSYGIVPDDSKLLLKNILDDDEYNVIADNSRVSFRFKYLTFLNSFLD